MYSNGGYKMEYQIIYGNRTTLGIQITPEGHVVVRAPRHYPKRKIRQFVRMKKEWIHKKAEGRKTDAWYINAQPYQKEEKVQYLDSALEIFTVKADYYAALMGISYTQIEVTEKYGQWGKCTKDGRLLFNWRLILAPEEVLDYVVINTLARVKNYPFLTIRMVEQVMPDFQVWKQWLKERSILLWSRE